MAFLSKYVTLGIGYISTIKITDIIDIAIVAFVIYKLLIWGRNTRTGQVLKGILLIVLALWISYQFNFHVLNFILSKAVEIGFVALVVVFQPEIRRFLEQVGSKGFIKLSGKSVKPLDIEKAIQETTAAFGSMSSDHIGALVVFERDTILDDYIRTGTEIDAETSSELLKNIFWPKAPLHDGAVIIRNGKIVSAGCVLPLSTNLNISRDLGTRHRAGIGMSEHSDAVVAIVSEETGAISVAVGGMLKRHLSVDTFERLLRNELMPAKDVSSKSRFLIGLFSRKKGDGNDVV